MANNLSGGFIGRQKLTDTSFVTGQRTGDLTSLLLGITEISAGGGMTQAGGLALSAGGAGAAVGAPMTAAGLALAGHGIVVTNSAVKNLASDNFVRAKGKSSSEVPAASGENIQYKVKKSGLSGKEGAKDPPDWAKGHRPRVGESGKEFAKRLMDEKFGSGKYKTGPGSHFSQIKKWADRSFENPKPKK